MIRDRGRRNVTERPRWRSIERTCVSIRCQPSIYSATIARKQAPALIFFLGVNFLPLVTYLENFQLQCLSFLPRFQVERFQLSLQFGVFVQASNLFLATLDFLGVFRRHRTSKADVVVVPPIEIPLSNPGMRGWGWGWGRGCGVTGLGGVGAMINHATVVR